MRDYALTLAASTENAGFSLLTLARNWNTRRKVRVMLDFDAPTLASAGLSHADVARVLRLPLSDNPLLALEQVAFRRMR